jgi:hypothetical protein
MGLRFLAAVALFLILAFVVRNWWRRLGHGRAGKLPARLKPTVQCARCGTYLPRATAVQRDGAFYCSQEHAAGPEDTDAGR